jgi:hypothetical protein
MLQAGEVHMAAEVRRTIKTVTGAGGQGRDIYDEAIDPSRSTTTLRENLGLPVETLSPATV